MPDKRILNAVESAEKDFRNAQRKFDKETQAIQEKARRAPVSLALTPDEERYSLAQQLNYNAKIVEEFASVTADYWAACEALILSLDAICRPLLKENPSATVIGTVARFISDIIKDVSEVRIDFTASLNQSSLGDVGSINPKSSVIAQTLERFWREAYKEHPDYAKRIKDEEDTERKRIQENKKKIADELKETIAREQALTRAAASIKEAREIIIAEGNKRISIFEQELLAEVLRLKTPIIEAEKVRLQSELQKAMQELKAVGFFDFANKKAIKAKISSLNQWLENPASSPEIAQQLNDIDSVAAGALNEYKDEINRHIASRFSLKETQRSFGTPKSSSAYDYKIMIDILNFLASNRTPQHPEAIEEACHISSSQKNTALLRQLMVDDFVVRGESGGRAVYSISPALKVTEVEIWEENKKEAKKGIPCPPADIQKLFK